MYGEIQYGAIKLETSGVVGAIAVTRAGEREGPRCRRVVQLSFMVVLQLSSDGVSYAHRGQHISQWHDVCCVIAIKNNYNHRIFRNGNIT